MAKALTRRNLLIGTAAGAAAVAGGTGWLALQGAESSMLAFLRRKLPGVVIDEESALACIRSVLERQWSWNKQRVAGIALGTIGPERMAELDDRFDSVERRVLTEFIIRSNFFHLEDPTAETIVYEPVAPGTPCSGNPFAITDA